MKRLEVYLIRTVLIALVAAIAVSPFFAVGHLLSGVFHRTLDATHLFATTYLLLISLAFILISPIFGENEY